jgi:tRNA A-37 threonylcarbamoyl transferase component Bud32
MGALLGSGHVIAGRYRLVSAIGSGGMGTVWLGQDELLDRRVAVKEVSPPSEISEEERRILHERTLREARTAARLTHPNVVTIYDVVEDGGRPWIVMALISARSLRDIVQEDGPLSPQQAAKVALQVLAALNAAHALGIMHRDVKPGNVLIDADGRAVLADFGIARADDSPTLTSTGMLVGSPSYIAPERARGERGGPGSDLWSLGATLYAVVEGRPPYDRPGPLATLTAVVTEDPDPPRRAGPLWPVISGLLSRDPTQRLGSAAAGRMLRRIAEGNSAGRTAPYPIPMERGEPGEASVDRPRPGDRPGDAKRTRAFHPQAIEPAASPAVTAADAAALPTVENDAPAAVENDAPAAVENDAPAAVENEEPEPGPEPGEAAPEPVMATPPAPHPARASATIGTLPLPVAAAPAPVEPVPAPVAADLVPADLPPADLAPTELAPADLVPTELAPADLAPTELAPADLAPTELAPADLVPTELAPADLVPTELAPADLAPTELAPADLAAPGPAEPSPAAPVAAPADEPAPAATVNPVPARPVPARPVPPPVIPDRPTVAPEPEDGRASQRRRQLTWVLTAAAAVVVVVAGTLIGLNLAGQGARSPAPPARTSAGSSAVASAGSRSTPAGSTAPQPTAPSSAGGQAAVPAGYHTYHDPTGFSIAVPNSWNVSHQGHYVYLQPLSGGMFLLIDQSDHPQSDPLADWQQQEANRQGTYPGYHRIRLEAISYPQAEKAADWEFTYYRQGVLTHVLNRNVLANPTHAYALYWSTPASEWDQSFRIFQVLASTFRPASP